MKTQNAIITSTHLGNEDHGIMTCFLYLDYGGSGQGFGGYALDRPQHKGSKFIGRVGTAYGMEFIRQILETLEITSWEKLPKTHVRVRFDFDKVHAIGHIIKDKWFTPADDMKDFIT